MFTESLKERQAIAVANPQTINSGGTATITTGNGLNMADLRRARAFLNIGAVTGAGAVTFKLRASATSGGSFSDITNLTTNPTIAGITTANQCNCLEIRADQMPAGKPWLRAEATETGGQNVVADLILVGDESGYKPGNQFNTATLTNDVVAAV